MVCLLSLHSVPITVPPVQLISLNCFAFRQGHAIISGRAIWREPGFGCLITLVRVLTTGVRRILPSTGTEGPPNPLVILCWGLYSGFSLWPCSNPVFSETPEPKVLLPGSSKEKEALQCWLYYGEPFSHGSLQPGPQGLTFITEGPIKVFPNKIDSLPEEFLLLLECGNTAVKKYITKHKQLLLFSSSIVYNRNKVLACVLFVKDSDFTSQHILIKTHPHSNINQKKQHNPILGMPIIFLFSWIFKWWSGPLQFSPYCWWLPTTISSKAV